MWVKNVDIRRGFALSMVESDAQKRNPWYRPRYLQYYDSGFGTVITEIRDETGLITMP